MNKLKLEYEMKMKGITAAEMCNALQISRSAFYRKCNGKTEFTRREIEEIIEILGIDKWEGARSKSFWQDTRREKDE